MNISFGKKIPIAKCSVFDNQQRQFIPVTVNEYDCKTMDDFVEVRKLDSTWKFADTIARSIYAKNDCFYKKIPNTYRFFNIERDNGEVIGIAACDEKQGSLDVNFIETKPDKKYKFAGQALLASLAGYSVNLGKFKLKIKNAIESSVGFYQNICGFKRNFEDDFEISKRDIPQFIAQTEGRTQTPIIELKG
jgi:hypothetical protein